MNFLHNLITKRFCKCTHAFRKYDLITVSCYVTDVWNQIILLRSKGILVNVFLSIFTCL